LRLLGFSQRICSPLLFPHVSLDFPPTFGGFCCKVSPFSSPRASPLLPEILRFQYFPFFVSSFSSLLMGILFFPTASRMVSALVKVSLDLTGWPGFPEGSHGFLSRDFCIPLDCVNVCSPPRNVGSSSEVRPKAPELFFDFVFLMFHFWFTLILSFKCQAGPFFSLSFSSLPLPQV